jgi:hypothetical protein
MSKETVTIIAAIIFFLALTMPYKNVCAEPVVNGVNGITAHGQVITVTGSGFGVKSPVAPLMWDPVDGVYEGLSNGDRIPVGGSNIWPGGYGGKTPYYKTVNPRGKWTAKYSNNPLSNNESSVERAAVGGKNFPEVGSGIMYVTWWNWVGYNGALANCQNKFTRFTYNGQWEVAAVIWAPDVSSGYDFSGWYAFVSWHGEQVNRGAWNRMEKTLDNGFLPRHPRMRLAVNNNEFLDCYSGKSGCTSGGSREVDLPNINGIGGIGWMPEFDFSSDAATVDFGEIYVDNTPARVEICNALTKAGSTHCEIQLPTNQWIDGQLQISVNQGSFLDGATAYLYVMDADGKTNADGYPVVFQTICAERAAKIEGQDDYYTDLQTAYNEASTGQTILSQAMAFDEDLNLNGGADIKLRGGYNCSFTERTGFTTMRSLTVESGEVTIEGIILR